MKKYIFSLLMIFFTILAQHLPAGNTIPSTSDDSDNWDITLGMGAWVQPDYEGSNDYDILPLPFLDIDYRDTYFSHTQKGLEGILYHRHGMHINAAIASQHGPGCNS